jgi:hypothetical protein
MLAKSAFTGRTLVSSRTAVVSFAPRRALVVENAHKKGAGSTKNGRDSQSKRRGVKSYGGQPIKAGAIIVRQLGSTVREPRGGACCRRAGTPAAAAAATHTPAAAFVLPIVPVGWHRV